MRIIDRTGFSFAMTELKVGGTLARCASSKRNPDRRQQTIRAARHAYDTSVQLAGKLQLTDMQQRDFHRKMVKLKAALVQLGELF